MTLGMALIGCQSQVLASGADAGTDPSRAGGAFGGSSVDAAGAFAVAATASATTICAGQCVDLSAQATGGVAPYSYAWDDGAPSATPSLQVCPGSTRTYSVVAHDASGSRGEISQTAATATASVTVRVSTTCAVAASDAGVTEIGQDAAPGSQVCLAEWPQPSYLLIDRVQMATDAAGDTFVVVEYFGDPNHGSPALNLGSPSPAYSTGLAVAKLDASCHLQWVREFGRSAALDMGVTTVAVHTDAASEVTVLGSFSGSADLGAGTVSTPTTSAIGGFLLRLDASGRTVFSNTFLTSQTESMDVWDLAVTPDGVSTVAIEGTPTIDFGTGPDVASEVAGISNESYLVQFDARGKLLYRKTAQSIDSSFSDILSLATNASGSLWAFSDINAPGTGSAVVAQLTASASENWKQSAPAISTLGKWLVGVGPSGQSVLWGATGSALLSAYSPTGATVWSTIAADAGGGGCCGAFAIDDNGQTTAAFYFNDTLSNASEPPLVSAGGYDVGFEQVDARGNVKAEGRFGGPEDEQLGGVGIDPSGNVVLAGWRSPPGATGAAFKESVFVVKIRP
jgi:hypothetical protein